MTEVKDLVHEVESARSRTENDLEKLESVKEEVDAEENLTSGNLRKLRAAYAEVKNDTKKEEQLIRNALETIHQIRKIKNQRRLEVKKIQIYFFLTKSTF